MRKVTTINLNGRAYQLEEPAYEKLQTYLHRAESTLAGNPDKAEVLLDIEQAIADKFERALERGKNVVSTKQLVDILERMGEVENSDDAERDTKQSTKSKKDDAKSSTEANATPKRLFVIREGSMLLGLAQGIGAYFGIDANIVRIIFIALTFATSGFWILVYILLGCLLPVARSEAELAEAYGKPVTAQDIVERAKERAPDSASLKRFSDATMRIIRSLCKVASVGLFVLFGIITAVWIWAQVQFMMGNFQFYDQLAVLNGWRQWVAITAAYAIIAVPLIGIARLLYRCSDERQLPTNVAVETALGLVWGLAATALITLAVGYGHNFADYVQQHQGYLDIGNNHICIDSEPCDNSNGDEGEPSFRPDYFERDGQPVPIR